MIEILDTHDPRRMKFCHACRREKSVSQFPWKKSRQQYCSPCIECGNANRRKASAAKRLKLYGSSDPRPLFPPVDIEMLRACIDAGMTSNEAAKKMGRNRQALTKARINNYLPPFRKPSRAVKRRPQWSDDRLLTVAQFRVAGRSMAQAGKALRVSRNAISGAIHRNRQRIQELIAHEANIAMGDRSRDVLRLPVEARLERG